ncbi:hypothetical protein RUND412_000589 [Rhizina undulata]
MHSRYARFKSATLNSTPISSHLVSTSPVSSSNIIDHVYLDTIPINYIGPYESPTQFTAMDAESLTAFPAIEQLERTTSPAVTRNFNSKSHSRTIQPLSIILSALKHQSSVSPVPDFAGAYPVILLSAYAHAAPLANNSAAVELLWVPAPQGRGTLDILLSCLFTIVICVWTALRLNVDPRPWFWRRLWNTSKYITHGIFMPEFVLEVASSQWWLLARYLRLRVKSDRLGGLNTFSPQILDLLFANLPAKDCRGLTAEVALYAIMGGFVVASKSNSTDLDAMEVEPITLTPQGFFLLLENSLLSEISLKRLHREVKGLSKAAMVAKVLLCLQVVTRRIVIEHYVDKSVLELKEKQEQPGQEHFTRTSSDVESILPDTSEVESSPLNNGDIRVRNGEQNDSVLPRLPGKIATRGWGA